MNNSILNQLLSALRRLRSQSRIALARASGSEIGTDCSFATGCDAELGFTPARRGCLVVGPRCQLEAGVILHPYGGSITLDENIFLGPGTVIYGHGTVSIGAGSLVAMHCRILSSNHTIPPFTTDIRTQPDILLPTKIGRDVWLGAGVTVLGGITIGDGCVVGAGSVVTKDLPAGCIAVGVPARITGWRTGAQP